ncbi:hypothetical protein BBJ29_001447 [Phytophthora kernoviae]|uniref:TrmE-type G domain-containing protein n=1 Tax=Phytophthora kernoviae TaxID=325452 RepID=A0A421G8T7_9STRA|nr:hypothetical protein BBJ29_001447 [Phytophthora kernoviae]
MPRNIGVVGADGVGKTSFVLALGAKESVAVTTAPRRRLASQYLWPRPGRDGHKVTTVRIFLHQEEVGDDDDEVFVLLFDLTRRKSLAAVIAQWAHLSEVPGRRLLLVGTHADRTSDRQLLPDEVREISGEFHAYEEVCCRRASSGDEGMLRIQLLLMQWTAGDSTTLAKNILSMDMPPQLQPVSPSLNRHSVSRPSPASSVASSPSRREASVVDAQRKFSETEEDLSSAGAQLPLELYSPGAERVGCLPTPLPTAHLQSPIPPATSPTSHPLSVQIYKEEQQQVSDFDDVTVAGPEQKAEIGITATEAQKTAPLDDALANNDAMPPSPSIADVEHDLSSWILEDPDTSRTNTMSSTNSDHFDCSDIDDMLEYFEGWTTSLLMMLLPCISRLERNAPTASITPPSDICTSPGKAGVAVIRISGDLADSCLQQLTKSTALPAPRAAALRKIYHPKTEEHLDDALVLRFPHPKSFTGEDIVELHTHGSLAVVSGVLEALSHLPRCRAAEAGEFTERAFDNNKIDLVQVEGLADLLSSETEAQRNQALRQLSGDIGEIYEGWRDSLVRCLAYTEAMIDFGDDEDDVTDAAYEAAVNRDTAGLRETEDIVEREGVLRAQQCASDADICVVMMDIQNAALLHSGEYQAYLKDGSLAVLNKSDQIAEGKVTDILNTFDEKQRSQLLVISCAEGNGIDVFVDNLAAAVKEKLEVSSGGSASGALITRERHRQNLVECLACLDRFLDDPYQSEIAAEDLRRAVVAIGRILGRIDVEDVLDVLFADFCIGK